MTDTTTKPNAATTLVMHHTFNASRERVYDAWTDPTLLCQFLGPEGIPTPRIQADAHVGGSYRIAFIVASGEEWIVSGVYRELSRPERIAFTWDIEEDEPGVVTQTYVTLSLVERDGKTELTLIHENLSTAERRDSHEKGWSGTLVKLERLLAV